MSRNLSKTEIEKINGKVYRFTTKVTYEKIPKSFIGRLIYLIKKTAQYSVFNRNVNPIFENENFEKYKSGQSEKEVIFNCLNDYFKIVQVLYENSNNKKLTDAEELEIQTWQVNRIVEKLLDN